MRTSESLTTVISSSSNSICDKENITNDLDNPFKGQISDVWTGGVILIRDFRLISACMYVLPRKSGNLAQRVLTSRVRYLLTSLFLSPPYGPCSMWKLRIISTY